MAGAGRRGLRRLSPKNSLQPGEKPLPETPPGGTLRAGGGAAQDRRRGGRAGTTTQDAFQRHSFPLPPLHPRQGVGEGGASAGRSTIGYRVAVRPRLANRIREEPCSPASVSEPAERAVCA